MRRCPLSCLLLAVAFGVSASTGALAAALFTVGPDAASAPRVLNQLQTAAPVSAAPLASLGDGSIGFNGGLAYNTVESLLYSIGNDSSGYSTLYNLTTSGGSLTAIAALGVGFNGGLAYDTVSGKFYAIANDIFAASALYEVTAAGVATALGPAFGVGFYGGLTYNADDGKLYAIAGDSFGVMRSVFEIDIATVVANYLFDLGDGSLGFNGGLAYDDAADLFYVIGNDSSVNSALYSFTLAGTGTLAAIDGSFGQGFLNAGLALAPAVTPPTVSEPPTLALVALVALLVLARARASTQRTAAWRSPSRRSPSA